MTQNGMYPNWLFRSAMRQTRMRLRRPFYLELFYKPDGVKVGSNFAFRAGGSPITITGKDVVDATFPYISDGRLYAFFGLEVGIDEGIKSLGPLLPCAGKGSFFS